jgi:hypothetical protein
MARPVTDEERASVAELHAQGMSRAAIARELGRGPATIGRIADQLGLTWDRSATVAATAAKVADLAARRAQLAGLLLDDAFRLRERLWEAYEIKQAVATADGGVVTKTIRYDLPPAGETRNLMTSAAVAVDKHLALVRADQDTTGSAAVDAWLEDMIGRFAR